MIERIRFPHLHHLAGPPNDPREHVAVPQPPVLGGQLHELRQGVLRQIKIFMKKCIKNILIFISPNIHKYPK